jgi:hypothetical protein
VRANEEVGSPKATGLALLGPAAVEATEGPVGTHRRDRTPMDPGAVNRIDALRASIPKGRLDSLVANGSVLVAGGCARDDPVVGGESGLLR